MPVNNGDAFPTLFTNHNNETAVDTERKQYVRLHDRIIHAKSF